jgi:hypothetical protein
VPVAIQRPEGTRIRNNGLLHAAGTLILNESSASPTGLRAAAGVSMTASTVPAGLPGLHTSVPITLVTPPGVPLAVPPFKTSPSTSKEPLPVTRLILALPLRVVQGPAPLWI